MWKYIVVKLVGCCGQDGFSVQQDTESYPVITERKRSVSQIKLMPYNNDNTIIVGNASSGP
jgi:hypothetical protein